ncbi:hypothetical protein ASF43_06270 [Pseudorhodoferax sp. Leaf267]|nr:hypothetical protein ASF43_06270 [Pseudorhodoferax sp. Leaf267]
MLALTAAGGLAACGGDGSDDEAPPLPAAVRMSCAEVTSANVNLPGVIVDAAVEVAAKEGMGGVGYPAHCYVTGRLNPRTGIDGKSYAIGFGLRLPNENWNGSWIYGGDSGLSGSLTGPEGMANTGMGGQTNPLKLGYALASSDGGHRGSGPAAGLDGSFGLDPQARLDYGYNAIGTWAPLAKQFVQKYYGNTPRTSYYVGCSKGGQTGMQAAARLADVFDGVLAGDPGFNLPKSGVAAMFDNKQLATVNNDVTKAFSPADLALVSSRILAKCDALDGASDGIVNDLAACKTRFDIAADVPQCAAGQVQSGQCLSASQVTALKNIMAGAKTSTGTPLYSDWPWDPGISSNDWVGWKTSLNVMLSPVAMSTVFSVPPTPGVNALDSTADAYWRAYDMDRSFEFIYGTDATYRVSSMDFMLPPGMTTLSTLKAKSKLLVYHGAADGIFSVNDTINWYSRLQSNDSNAAAYARLFVVPGMAHCGSGPSTDRFDAFSALVRWVEQGVAPDNIRATVSPGNNELPTSWSATRSRPLCPYPTKAVWKAGSVDLESADSFICQ